MKNYKINLPLALLLIFSGCGGGNPSITPGRFSSCSQIKEYIQKVNNSKTSPGPVVALSSAEDAAHDISFTNQEEGVEEGDFIAKDKDALYLVRAEELQVIDRTTLKSRGKIAISNQQTSKLFIQGDRLALIQSGSGDTTVTLFQLKSQELPEKLSSEKYPGSLIDLRLIKGNLAMAISSYISNEKIAEQSISGVPCDCVYKPFKDDSLGLTKIHLIDMAGAATQTSSLAVIGASQDLYMTKDKLFLNAVTYGSGGFWQGNSTTQIAMVDYSATDKKLALVAVGFIPGYLKDRFSLKWVENKGALLAATTNGRENYLLTLVPSFEELKIRYQSAAFGLNEDIRAVRFQDELALIVTFKKTDPLFAFNIKDPYHPELVSELKVPGFSSSLYPITSKITVGLGYDAEDMDSFAWFQGIQLSVFDVSNLKNLERKDVKVFGIRGSHSEATVDTHAFYQDGSKNRIGFPLTEMEKDSSIPYEYGTKVKFHGAVLYGVSEEGQLTEEARVTHSKFIPSECDIYGGGYFSLSGHKDISRILKLDNRLLTVSQFGVMQHDDSNPSQIIGEYALPTSAENPCFNLKYDFCGTN